MCTPYICHSNKENEELTVLIKKLKGLLYDTTKREKPLGIKAKET